MPLQLLFRVKYDIYTTEHIVSECGVVLEESSMPDEMDDNDYALLDKEPEDIEDEAELKKWLLFWMKKN